MADPILVPYGRLADGSFGFPDSATGVPQASVVEIFSTLPSTADSGNFPGRCVFAIDVQNMYLFKNTPSAAWTPLKNSPVVVGSNDPSSAGAAGDLYYATTSGILFLYTGSIWLAIAGALGSGIIWRHYVGDNVTSLFPSGSNQGPSVDYVQVFVDGEALSPGSVGVRGYYMLGNDVQLNATPALNAKVSIRTTVYKNVVRTGRPFCVRHVCDGTTNSFAVGTQIAQAGQFVVSLDGVIQTPDLGLGNGTYDYKIVSANNRVTSITASGATCTVTTEADHGFTGTPTVTIRGATPTAYNGAFTIAVTGARTFTYTAGSAPGANATGTIYFYPVTSNDVIRFYNASGVLEAPPNGLVLVVHGIENLVV